MQELSVVGVMGCWLINNGNHRHIYHLHLLKIIDKDILIIDTSVVIFKDAIEHAISAV